MYIQERKREVKFQEKYRIIRIETSFHAYGRSRRYVWIKKIRMNKEEESGTEEKEEEIESGYR